MRTHSRRPTSLVVAAAALVLPPWAGQESATAVRTQLTAAVRAEIERAYRDQLGLEFRSFDCPIEAKPDAGDFFECHAEDVEGDRLTYILELDEVGRAQVVRISQDARSLGEAVRAALEPSSRRLAAYAARDWDGAYETLHPALHDSQDKDQIRASLVGMRESLGAVSSFELASLANNASGVRELEYALSCEHGPGIARFQIAPGEGAPILGYLVTLKEGTRLHAENLRATVSRLLSGLVGSPVVRLDVPLERLARPGDAVEGTAALETGAELPILVERKLRPDQIERDKYSVSVLDAAFLIERRIADRSEQAESVDCPARAVEDGGQIICTARLSDGRWLAIALARRGGEHRATGEWEVSPLSRSDAEPAEERLQPSVEQGVVGQLATRLAEASSTRLEDELATAGTAVRRVRDRLGEWGTREVERRAPVFEGLGLPRSARPLLDTMLSYSLCNAAVMLGHSGGALSGEARRESVERLTAGELALTYLRAAFLEGGGAAEEVEGYLTSESWQPSLDRLQTEPGLLEETSARCRAVLSDLLS